PEGRRERRRPPAVRTAFGSRERRGAAAQPFAPAGLVVMDVPSSLLAFWAYVCVNVSAIFTLEMSRPRALSIAAIVAGPPAGMMPSGRNCPLSVVRPEM